MHRFLLRPRWIAFHVIVVAAILAMVNLGFWQLRRLDERREFNATVETRYDAPTARIDDVLAAGIEPDDVEWRPVTVTGSYVSGERVLIVNRSQNGRAGYNAVEPLDLGDGRVLLVNRGFFPLAEPTTDAPTGTVTVTGRLRTSQQRGLGQLADPADGDLVEAQRVDIPRLSPQIDGDLVEMYVDLMESDPAETVPFPEQVAPPDLGEGNHLSYAVQWFIFSAAVAVGWVLAVRRSVRTHARGVAEAQPTASEG